MLLKFNLLFGLIFLVSHLSSADGGNKIGNGGDVIICKKLPSLLDFFEVTVLEVPDQKNPFQIAKAKFEALQMIDPKTAKVFLKRLEQIKNEINFRNDVKLTDIPDSAHLSLPKKNCRLVQIAIRQKIVTAGEKRFLIREDLWKKLPPLHQGGLLSHEIIYEYLSQLGETDSVKARKINGLLFGPQLSSSAYWELIKTLELPIYP